MIIFIVTLLCCVIYFASFFVLLRFKNKIIYPVPNRSNEVCANRFDHVVYRNDVTLYHKENDSSEVVVFYHGNGHVVCDLYEVMDVFDRNDVSYIFPEYIGYDDDEKPSHEGVIKTVEETVVYLEEQSYESVYVIGQSIGSGAAAYHTSLRDPDTLLLTSPFTSLARTVKSLFPFYPRFLINKFFDNQFDSQKNLKNYMGNLIIVHGENDSVVKEIQGRDLFDSVQTENKKFIAIPKAGHGDLYNFEEVFRLIENLFIEK